jgi:hypothetical protein
MDGDFDPFATPGDDRQYGGPGIGDPHIVLQLGHVFFGGGFFGERPGQHELGFKDRAAGGNEAVEGRRHPLDDGVLDPLLHVLDGASGVTFVPVPVEVFGDGAELDNQESDRSSGSTSPRFSRQRRTRSASWVPMITRASEPPIKERRSGSDCLYAVDFIVCPIMRLGL